jgi:hypothetical protein
MKGCLIKMGQPFFMGDNLLMGHSPTYCQSNTTKMAENV